MDILLIDDNPQVAGIIVSKLAREGFLIVWKKDEDLAFLVLKGTLPRLILLSTYLESKNAFEVLRQLTKSYTKIPVLMILEQEEANQQDLAKSLGSVGCIVKPFKPTVLAKTVKSILAV